MNATQAQSAMIDTHTHFYDPFRPEGVPWPPKDNTLLYRTVLPEHYIELAKPLGITGTVVVEASSWREDNSWILELAEDEPFLLGLVGHIDPKRPAFRDDLARYADHPLFCGIRCGGNYFEDIDDGSFMDDMEHLASLGMELDVLIRDGHLENLCKLAMRIPELPIVVNHIAHMPIDGNPVSAWWREQYARLASYSQIHMKVSAVIEQSVSQPAPESVEHYTPALVVLWECFGEDRLIFGSNWPVVERAGSLATSLEIVKTFFGEKGQTASDKYFYLNATRVYGISSVR